MEPVSTPAIPSISPVSTGLRYGLLIGLVSVVISFLALTFKLHESWSIRILSVVVLVAGIILAQREFKRRNDGFMSYGEGLVVALLAGCVVGVISTIFLYVYAAVIAPEFQQEVLEKAREGMEARGTVSDEQIEKSMALTSRFMMPILLGVTLLGSVFYSLIIGLISSAFIKNTKSDFD